MGSITLADKLEAKYGISMTPNEAAAELHQHPTHIRELCKQGLLPAVCIGRRWHINTEKFAMMLDGSLRW